MYRYKLKSLPKNPDLIALVLAEQISRDYIETLRNEVVPIISKQHNLKLREIRVLMCLECSSEHFMSASEVAEYLRQDRATIARSSIMLIGNKCIYTAPNLDDSRVKNLYLTTKGTEIAKACTELFENYMNRIEETGELEATHKERDEAIDLLKTLEGRAHAILQLSKRTKKSRS